MEPGQIKQPDEQPETPLVESDKGIFEAYANIVDADWSLTDVTIRFMQIAFIPREEAATTKNRELVYVEKANITMAWLQIKILVAILNNLVQAYESVNGELKPTVLPQLQRADQP